MAARVCVESALSLRVWGLLRVLCSSIMFCFLISKIGDVLCLKIHHKNFF